MYERSFDGFVSLCFDIKEKYSGALHISNIHNLNNIISCGNDFNNSHPIRASLNGISIDFFEKIKTENEDIYNNDNIVLLLDNAASDCINIIGSYLIPKILYEYSGSISEIENRILNIKNDISKIVDKSKKYIEDIYREQGEKYFESIFSNHEKHVIKYKHIWLITVGVLVFIEIIFLYKFYMMSVYNYISNWFTFVHLFAIKFFILALIFWILTWCVKMYQLSRNQEILTIHKKAILASCRFFIQSTSDNSVRSIVLTTAVKEFFTLPSTGYVPGKESNLDVLEQTTKIATELVSKAKPTGTA